MNRAVRVIRGAVLAFACMLALFAQPLGARASDLANLAEYYGLQPPIALSPRTLSRDDIIEESPTGVWVEHDPGIIEGAKQVNEYRIASSPNEHGKILVELRTTIYNFSLPVVMWTTTKTIYCDGAQVAYIGKSYETAGPGGRITQSASFEVSEGGIHHITSIEKEFQGGTQIEAGWDFHVFAPYIINVSKGEGGTISPDKPTYAKPGSSLTCTIEADDGYRIDQVTIDGTPCGPLFSHTFTDIDADHSISATFQKVWTVVFVDRDGEELAREVVDDGASVTPPDIPDVDGYASCGWDQDLSQVRSDMVVRPLYEPIISVRVPTSVSCTLLPSGEVVAGDAYAIENDSVVPVRAVRIETIRQAPHTSLELLDNGTPVWSTSGTMTGFSIGAHAAKPLSWHVAQLDASLNAELIAAATQSPQELCLVSFTFEAA